MKAQFSKKLSYLKIEWTCLKKIERKQRKTETRIKTRIETREKL